MTNRKLIRRMLFATALTMSTGAATEAFAYQQYQPGEPGKQIPQGNTTVTQELNRMFQESGQEMPSMISQELPNANVPTQGQIRPKQGANQPSTPTVVPTQQKAAAQNAGSPQNRPVQQNMAQTQQNKPTAKPGVLGKFFGKFRGDTVPKNPNYQPPVPPDFNASASKPKQAASNPAASNPAASNPAANRQVTNNTVNPAANGNANPSVAVGSASPVPPVNGQVSRLPSSNGQQPQNTARPAQANSPNRMRNQSPTSQAYNGNSPQSALPGNAGVARNGAASRIPPRSGSTVQPVNRPTTANAAVGTNSNQSEYTQPGSAPAFMTTTGSAAVINKQAAPAPKSADKFDEDFKQENLSNSAVPVANPNRSQNPVTPNTVTAATAPVENAFDSPFLNGADSTAESEVLDLDSLIDIPAGPSSPDTSVEVTTTDASPDVVEQPKTAETDGNAVEGEGSTESQLGPNENPFTGIQLDTSDAEFFGGAEPAAPASGESPPAAPMEDFSADLPAMDLSLDGTPSDVLPSVDLPGVDDDPLSPEQPEVASPVSQPEANRPDTNPSQTADADTAGRAELQASPDVPAAMSEAETEHLRQIAEQERRKQQKRLIQSRAGQTGFKGFCPVALRERRELVEANPQFTSTFGLQSYTFSSAESKAAFDAEPSRYAPAAGGSDVVVLVNSGEEQAGQLDYALWYRDRLYLFRSRETMTLFSKDPLRFASQY